ncbi:MAG: 23S rRNA (uracil(1939)-C(5))-methyltransferase RlmD [Candidatus Desulfofervidaceae bacterium]|nr:23S rRNA (uracil(1939)-C(5))-methyltransferase RlmD [Candidatus Desulfofervidaceae bacterium]
MQIKIEKLVFGGWGLGKYKGKVVFVPYVLPEEVVEVALTKEKKNYAFARLIEIISPSPERQSPPCPYFTVCGGCDYQHIPYSLQTEVKQKLFQEEFTRLTGLEITELLKPMFPSPSHLFYRNRVQLKVEREGYKIKIGFYKRDSRELVAVDKCLLAEKLINQTISALQEVLQRHIAIGKEIKGIEIFVSPDEGSGIVILSTLVEVNKRHLQAIAEELMSALPFLKDVLFKHRAFAFPRSLFEKGYTQSALLFKIDDFKIMCYPGVFFQINTNQNKILSKIVTQLAALHKEESVLELYAGIGNLSLPLSAYAKRVVGLESNCLTVKNANYNAQLNKTKAFFKIVNVETALESFLTTDDNFNCLLVDPPRQGCIRALKQSLNFIQPTKIIYVSCHPATLARDINYLLKSGYKLKSLQLIDMFPQTQHIETVALLHR